jgi:hypothetical protein
MQLALLWDLGVGVFLGQVVPTFTARRSLGRRWHCGGKVCDGNPRYSALLTKSLSLISKAVARALATSIPTLTLPSSMELMYVR